jgi:DNA-binding response OmpR family regulator
MATVLMVPRNTMVSDLIGELVGVAGYRVVYPTHDESILGRVTSTGARVALVEVERTDSDEVGIARHLQLAGVPVIVFSGRLFEERLARMTESVAAAVVALPTTARALGQKIEAALAPTGRTEPIAHARAS